MSETIRTGPTIKNLGNFDTIANLETARPASSQYPGTCAFCDDAGWVWSDSTAWRTMYHMGVGATKYYTTGGGDTVPSAVRTVILNGVATTYALTFPAPRYDGQVLEVNAATDVSVAFSAVVTSPGTVINTVPATLAAGVGVSWIYKVADTTWYRRY